MMNGSHDRNLLPSGKWADYVWNGLSKHMRDVLQAGVDAGDCYWLPSTAARTTLTALARRGITEKALTTKLTEDGKALVEWMKDNERNK